MIRVAIISFPGNNCEVESIRAVRRAGMEPVSFRWNDDRGKLENIDAYFLVGGFSYEDRGRSGMVAARDPLFAHISKEAAAGKAVIGNCNGAQMLVESGLVPLGNGLRMSLAKNAVTTSQGFVTPGFINEWVWIKPACKTDRCATSDWTKPMHVPIAHGEGRFMSRDPEVIAALAENDQIAFCYCDAEGNVSEDVAVTPNGSVKAIAGICNPAGNVVALMPHPERTAEGDVYFASLKNWIEARRRPTPGPAAEPLPASVALPVAKQSESPEVFIDTVIVNNEERTVEQALRRLLPDVRLKQYRYVRLDGKKPADFLSHVSFFNNAKETAFVRSGKKLLRWNGETEEVIEALPAAGTMLLRVDEPDTLGTSLGGKSVSGVCYVVQGAKPSDLERRDVQEVLANPNASTLSVLS